MDLMGHSIIDDLPIESPLSTITESSHFFHESDAFRCGGNSLLNIYFSVTQPFHHLRVTMVKETTCFCV